MPCRDWQDEATEGHENYLKGRNDLLARIACDALSKIDMSQNKKFFYDVLSKETKDWWEEHKKQDAKHNKPISIEEPHG